MNEMRLFHVTVTFRECAISNEGVAVTAHEPFEGNLDCLCHPVEVFLPDILPLADLLAFPVVWAKLTYVSCYPRPTVSEPRWRPTARWLHHHPGCESSTSGKRRALIAKDGAKT